MTFRNSEQDNTYRTSDTILGAFLVTKQFALLFIDYDNPRFEFVFPASDEIDLASKKYLSGSALIEPTAFARVNRKLLRCLRKRCQWEED